MLSSDDYFDTDVNSPRLGTDTDTDTNIEVLFKVDFQIQNCNVSSVKLVLRLQINYLG